MPTVTIKPILDAIKHHKRIWGKYPDMIKGMIYNAIDNQIFDNPEEWKKETNLQINKFFNLENTYSQGELF